MQRWTASGGSCDRLQGRVRLRVRVPSGRLPNICLNDMTEGLEWPRVDLSVPVQGSQAVASTGGCNSRGVLPQQQGARCTANHIKNPLRSNAALQRRKTPWGELKRSSDEPLFCSTLAKAIDETRITRMAAPHARKNAWRTPSHASQLRLGKIQHEGTHQPSFAIYITVRRSETAGQPLAFGACPDGHEATTWINSIPIPFRISETIQRPS